MRKLLLILGVIIAMCANAENFKFLGIPINGPITSFQTQLVSKGFKLLKTESDGRLYTGKFYGEQVHAYVLYDPKIKTVFSVIVIFPDKRLINNRAFYDNLKSSLSEKYVLVDETEESKYAEPFKLRTSKFLYGTVENVIGVVDLSEESEYNDYRCVLDYYDLENYRMHNKSQSDDL